MSRRAQRRILRQLQEAANRAYPAIPLAPPEAGVLITAWLECDTLRKAKRLPQWGTPPSGIACAAQELLHRAGAAAASGASTIPLLTSEISGYDDIRDDLHSWLSSASQTRAEFDALYPQLHIRSGQAAVLGWKARFGNHGLEWASEPKCPEPTGRPELDYPQPEPDTANGAGR